MEIYHSDCTFEQNIQNKPCKNSINSNKIKKEFKENIKKYVKLREWSDIVKIYPSSTTRDNYFKNRYSDVLPKETTKVSLENSYVNANIIDINDYKCIASQAPTKNNFIDHYNMIWEYKLLLTVNLTDFIEKDIVKADAYWPLYIDEELIIDKYYIKCNSIHEYDHFKIYHLRIINGNESLNHSIIHYTNWPDNDVPIIDHIISIIKKIELYEDSFKNINKITTLYHCSAGVGRTGTMIGLYIIYKLSMNSKEMNITNIFHDLRKCRDLMINRYAQYEFLYKFKNYIENLQCEFETLTNSCVIDTKTSMDN